MCVIRFEYKILREYFIQLKVLIIIANKIQIGSFQVVPKLFLVANQMDMWPTCEIVDSTLKNVIIYF